MQRNFHFFLRLRSRLLWPLLMLQTITPHALSSPTMPLVSEPGRRPKPQYISAMEHLFPFRGGAGPRHAPTFFCAATLHDSLFWEAQVGTWDTKLTKHLVSLQWGQLVPWQCRWPCSATRWTTRSCISWQSRKRGISCLHNFRPRRGEWSDTQSPNPSGGIPPQITGARIKSEPLRWTALQFRVFPWLPPNACWEEIQNM